MSDLTIAGAGMAGLVAAARARQLGLRVRLLEKGDRPGGSMRLSSGVVWRHHSLEDFRAACPGGDPALQELIVDRLDDAIAWLETLGAEVVSRDWGNPANRGARFEPRALTEALARAAGVRVELRTPLGPSARAELEGGVPILLATGGFQGSRELVRSFVTREAGSLLLRANRWSRGDGLELGLARGAALSSGLDEFYGRCLPVLPKRPRERDFVPLAQLYGRLALVVDEQGRTVPSEDVGWSEIELAQRLARRPAARGWYVLDAAALPRRLPTRSVAEMIAAAEAAGGEVRRAPTIGGLELGELEENGCLREPPFLAVHVQAAITHTIGGLRVDEQARVLDERGRPIPGLLAAGVDAGGVATGGYASGLAQALVLGLVAAETAAG
ncbi:MAG: FAD-dependent oxidoreductase [Gaiellaceae bacterium]